jgi:phospholipid-transporting ATPase
MVIVKVTLLLKVVFTENVVYEPEVTNVNFSDPVFDSHKSDPHHENYKHIKKCITLLSVCHTIIPQEKEGKIFYNASSPDELALVNGARHMGAGFQSRDSDNLITINM